MDGIMNEFNARHSEINSSMRPFPSTDNHYNPDSYNAVGRYQLSNIRQGQDNNFCGPNKPQTPNNCHFSPEKSELEKLFSHATEVKGDLESVIHALVGIIGNNSTEPSQYHPVESMHYDYHPLNELKNEMTQNFNQDYNFNWQHDNTPSVNVENVLKNVRANKLKSEKFYLFTDGNQSSGSSKERLGERTEFNSTLHGTNIVHKESFRSMLSDPGYLDQARHSFNDHENPRKHKSLYSKLHQDDNNWNSTEFCVKKIRSTNPSVDFSDDISMQLDSDHQISDPILPEASNHWPNSNQFGGNNQYNESFCKQSKSLKENKSCLKSPDSNIYCNFSRNNWSPGKDFLNEVPVNNYIDESSCSSWSKVSPNNSHSICPNVAAVSANEKYCKQTPSVSVSDSEGSIEPVRDPPVKRIPRLPSLCTQLRNKQGKYELILLNQPEQQHRARYMTEGSRGAVKDRSGNGYPTVQLLGWKQPATLQIFVGSEDGRVKPHNFYQACKVTGKQVSSCKERIFDNAGLIEVQLDAKENQIIILDCIGILKLRNVDVERRAGIQRIKQKSTMARLVFRVNLPHGDGYFTCLQVISDSILCTQPIGTPEISKMSLYEGSCKGNMELFIIGKNIVKGAQVFFQDFNEQRGLIWQCEAKIDTEYLQQTHLICIVPPYCNDKLISPVTVQVVLNCASRISEPRYFTYLPDWKTNKANFNEPSSFPMGNSPGNLDIPNHQMSDTLTNSSNEILFEGDYIKPNKNLFNSSELYNPIRDDEGLYSNMIPQNKLPISTNNQFQMGWMASKDIPLSNISPPNERFFNSLDSDIENECVIKNNLHFPVSRIKALNTQCKSGDILTNL